MDWLIAYDVQCHHRRARLARRCERAGLRLQRSVFLVDASPPRLRELFQELAPLVDPAHDHLAAWPLSESWPRDWLELGRPLGPVERQVIVL